MTLRAYAREVLMVAIRLRLSSDVVVRCGGEWYRCRDHSTDGLGSLELTVSEADLVEVCDDAWYDRMGDRLLAIVNPMAVGM